MGVKHIFYNPGLKLSRYAPVHRTGTFLNTGTAYGYFLAPSRRYAAKLRSHHGISITVMPQRGLEKP